jgi:hypothetical protein
MFGFPLLSFAQRTVGHDDFRISRNHGDVKYCWLAIRCHQVPPLQIRGRSEIFWFGSTFPIYGLVRPSSGTGRLEPSPYSGHPGLCVGFRHLVWANCRRDIKRSDKWNYKASQSASDASIHPDASAANCEPANAAHASAARWERRNAQRKLFATSHRTDSRRPDYSHCAITTDRPVASVRSLRICPSTTLDRCIYGEKRLRAGGEEIP